MGMYIVVTWPVATHITLGNLLFAFTGSAISLAAGVLFGGLAAAGTFQMSNDPQNCYLLLGQSVFINEKN